MKNANEFQWSLPYHDAKVATVKVFLDHGDGTGSNCTGTLVSQATELGQLRQLLVLSRHCIFEGALSSDLEVDFASDNHIIAFHYQSPDGVDNSTPLNNRGIDREQTFPFASDRAGIGPGDLIDDGFRFSMETTLGLIAHNQWGDYALVEIETPIPPHFYAYYSGYDPDLRFIKFHPVVGFHHPGGDIKATTKYATWRIYDKHTRFCHIITDVIDFLFGWIWKRRSSTRRICRLISIPFYIGFKDKGHSQDGSSGSGAFDNSPKHIAALSGGSVFGCNVGITHYSRNADHYFDKDIRNVFNPSHNTSVDNYGYGGTYMNCYEDLNLHGFYWPHSEHSQNGFNHVPITSNGNINLASNENGDNIIHHVFSGSDYSIKAGNGIFARANPSLVARVDIQNDNFFVESGSNLFMGVTNQPCSRSVNSYKSSREKLYRSNRMLATSQIKLPPLGTDRTESRLKGRINLYPNPASTDINIRWSSVINVDEVRIITPQGSLVNVVKTKGSVSRNIEISGYSNGLYIAQFVSDKSIVHTEKFQVLH